MANKNKTFNAEINFGAKISPSMRKTSQTVCAYLKQISGPLLGLAGLTSFGVIFNTIKDKTLECVDAAKAEIDANTKLEAVLKNVASLQKIGPNAYKAATEQLRNQAGAIQKVGVIGDEVTVAGMQQLATFQLSNKEISKLAPGMTDLLAQQKGLNAEQADAVNIANMIGKAMTGQVGALSRVGITFTKAQAKALKTGNSIQRAAVLAKVLQQNVGGVNAALAETDQGKIQQTNNEWSDMQERIGMKVLPLIADWQQSTLQFLPIIEDVVSFAISGAGEIVNAILPIMDTIANVINFIGQHKDIFAIIFGSAVVTVLKANIGAISWAVLGFTINLWSMVTATWAAIAPWIPLGLAIAGVATIIMYCVKHFDELETSAINAFNSVVLKAQELWAKIQPIFNAIADAMKFAFNFTPAGLAINALNAVKENVTKHNALGSNSFVGGETWVGEHGPERVILPRGSQILSNNKSKDNASGSVNIAPVFNFTVQGSADQSVVQNAVTSTVPTIKQQIDAYFRDKQRRGLAFA